MKKKIISALLCASMVATMVAGCGGSSDTTSTDNSNSGAAGRPRIHEEAAKKG